MSDFDTSFIRLKRHETTQGHVAENKSWGRGESKIFKQVECGAESPSSFKDTYSLPCCFPQLGLVNHLSFSKAFPPFLAVTTETRVSAKALYFLSF